MQSANDYDRDKHDQNKVDINSVHDIYTSKIMALPFQESSKMDAT